MTGIGATLGGGRRVWALWTMMLPGAVAVTETVALGMVGWCGWALE